MTKVEVFDESIGGEMSVRQAGSVVPVEKIEKAIFMIRGQKVMLSTHLADLYDVAPKVLMQSVKRNLDRFPEDFMFQLSAAEFENLKSQFVTSSWGGMRSLSSFLGPFPPFREERREGISMRRMG